MLFSRYNKEPIKPFLCEFGRCLLKVRYTPVNVTLRNNNVFSSFSTPVIEMSRKDILLSCCTSKVNFMLR